MQHIIMFLFLLSINSVDMLIAVRYQKYLYGKPIINSKLFFLATFVLSTVMSIFMIQVNALILWGIVLSSSFLLGLYSPNRNQKILFQTVLVSLAVLSLVVTYILSSIIIKNPTKLGVIVVLLPHLLFYLFTEICLRLKKSSSAKLPVHMWILLSSIPFASLICVPNFTRLIDISPTDAPLISRLEIPVLFVVLYINIIVFYLFDKFSALHNARVEKVLLNQQIEMQEKYYQSIEQNHQRIRGLQHDMKKQLQTITSLFNNRDYDELQDYLTELNGTFQKADKLIVTGNTVIDTILNIKIAELKANSIQVTSSVLIPKNLKLTFEQAVILLGNILDNAMEACVLLPPDQRRISIKLGYADNILYINLINSMVETQGDGHTLQTKKNDTFLHGIGMKNVQRIVDDFHGTMKVKHNGGEFQTTIILYGI